jgi:hypothetical protein
MMLASVLLLTPILLLPLILLGRRTKILVHDLIDRLLGNLLESRLLMNRQSPHYLLSSWLTQQSALQTKI